MEGKRGPSAPQSKSMTFRNLSASPLREVLVSCLSSLCLNSIDLVDLYLVRKGDRETQKNMREKTKREGHRKVG